MYACTRVLQYVYIFIYRSSMDHFSRTSGIRNFFFRASRSLVNGTFFKLFHHSHFSNVNGAGSFLINMI